MIHDFYREADRFIGKVFKLVDEHTNLVVMADHGFEEFTKGRGKFELNVSAMRKLFSIHTAARVVRIGDAFIMNMGGAAVINKPVTELSVGQQQRVAAARALIGAPGIIIADEPTSSLDTDHRQVFIQLLFKECHREETTLVFVSHDTAFEKLFDRTIRLADINAV